MPLNQSLLVQQEQNLVQKKSIATSSFKPFIFSRIKNESDSTNLLFINKRYENRSFAARKLFFEHLISLDTGLIHLSIDPLLNLELGEELSDDPRNNSEEINLYKNTRGFNLKLAVGSKIAIESSFRENQANLPFYLDERTERTQMAYGQGRVKTFNEEGFDFSMSSAYISYDLKSNINIQAGHGKHFVGSGHRSLLLSDLSYNYPFLRFNTSWFGQKLHYHNLYASLQNLNRLPSSSLSENLFERKYAAFHYLEYKVGSHLSIGLFEGVIFPGLDSSGNQSTSVNYWLPVIYLNSLIEAPDRTGNSIIGLNIELQLFNQLKLYQQLAFYDEENNAIGFQSGFKWFLSSQFMFQAEVNNLNHSFRRNEYNHNGESLAHPIQAEALEVISIFQFRKDRWLSRLSNHYFDVNSNEILYIDFRQSYIVNPSNSLSLNIGVQHRDDGMNSTISQSTYLYFGLSTNLQNLYFNY